MTRSQVFIIGETLYAETLTHLLADSEEVEIAGTATTPAEALPSLRESPPDALILASIEKTSLGSLDLLLEACPDVPLLCTNLNDANVQMFTHRKLNARFSTLLEALTQIPPRRSHEP
ncbi:MAG: hypothetical protein HUU38_07025 [Anaerolineales bacterium]|nr:hypothetical protein [Anaerolineales bacterium]